MTPPGHPTSVDRARRALREWVLCDACAYDLMRDRPLQDCGECESDQQRFDAALDAYAERIREEATQAERARCVGIAERAGEAAFVTGGRRWMAEHIAQMIRVPRGTPRDE